MRLQSLLVVSATRWVPKSILLHECCPLLLGFANAPDTLSIPALQFTFAMSRAWADTSRDSLLAQFDMAPSCRPALFGRTNAYASSPRYLEVPSKPLKRG